MNATEPAVCGISWIDCAGNATPDSNPAVGFAVATWRDGTSSRYPICASHLASMGQVHHGKCHHVSRALSGEGAKWTFEPLERQS